jgi:hypothetical protein
VSANIVGKAESVWVTVVRRPLPPPPAAGGCPSFYRPRREQLTCVPHYFYTCSGMANSAAEQTAVLANPAPVEASWCVLCLCRSDFEGCSTVVG